MRQYDGKIMKKHIEVVSYNNDWPAMFSIEETIIRTALGDNCVAIYHVGSTAVPGLAAKPKIDIVAVAKDREKAIIDLEKVGYTHRGEWGIPLKCGFAKRGATDVNLHLFFDENHPEIELNLKFRDYLKRHPDVCDEYAATKEKILQDDASQEKIDDFPVYTLRKRIFIDNIIKNLGFRRLRVLKCATDDEWNAAKNFRKKHPDQIIDTGPNHKHFMLYHGVEIIGYADIHILSKTEAEALIFEVADQVDQSAREFFLDVIKEWTNVHRYKQTKNSISKL
jgi:GrpB-like predicted nucleotidyltransferase (UPF0157 family)